MPPATLPPATKHEDAKFAKDHEEIFLVAGGLLGNWSWLGDGLRVVMYPLKFVPVFQKRLWGGQKLRAVLGRPVPAALGPAVGESWELADLPAGTVKADSAGGAVDGALSSVIANGAWAGKRLREVMQNSACRIQNGGEAAARGYFPLLIKYLDAAQDLSVQVHPDAAYAAGHPGAALKSEAWYILQAEPGAKIYKGVKAGVTKEQFAAALKVGEVEPLLHAIKVRAGDCHYLESGTVHALGAGLLVAEVQTPSDTTFRVFDWNRLGADGKARTLHIEEALACIRFGAVAERALSGSAASGGTRLAECEHFTIDRVEVGQGERRMLDGEMSVWIILQGQGVIAVEGAGGTGTAPTAFARGDTILLPGGMKGAEVRTIAECEWLDVRVPRKGATV